MLTIVTPAETFDLTTLAAVKAQLGISGTDEDTNLDSWISQASDAIAKFCNRVFAQETVAETVRLKGREDGLLLSRFPVTEIVSVTENGTVLTGTDYELDGDGGVLSRLRSDRVCGWACSKTVVTYTAGYAPDDLPEGIERAAIMLVAHYRATKDREPFRRSVEIPDVISESFQDIPASFDLPPEIHAHLDRLRMPAGAR